MERIVLTAMEGMILTDGVNYGTKIYLPIGQDELIANYYEISLAEYKKILEEENIEEE